MSKSIIYQYFITKTNHRKQGLDFWDFLISQNMDDLNYQRLFFWGGGELQLPPQNPLLNVKFQKIKKWFISDFGLGDQEGVDRNCPPDPVF